MANEIRRLYGTQKTLESSGASIASAAIGQATTGYSSTDTLDYPDAVFALTCAFGGAPTAGTTISLVIAPQNIDGTSDAAAPTASYVHHFFGSFAHNGAAASQTLYCEVQNVPKEGIVWLFNNATGQTLSSGWVLKMTPLSYQPI